MNRTKRLIKAPKLYWGDTGIALHLAGSQPQGSHLENLVLQDLLVWRDARIARAELGYWRTTIGEEVDFVIEAGNKLLPIELKATGSPRLAVCWQCRGGECSDHAVTNPVGGLRQPVRCRCNGAMNGFAACQGRSC
ncbi:DUF4143 domain-containing protein [Cyanobium sp. BA20m-p-22]|uniref:DUF4143 domain-containing protein n=1 Tax=Cyanobium sp. BA20m-p-22 TaxID=2823704 RepID=UPI0020CC6E94|nr:DUF4143 domain-containing protein [Cyanobium sp. BA20m-p-22]MCP9911143.1 DUF4143 domain-containing protein [Cyanobium sp. BA20m-p-22]